MPIDYQYITSFLHQVEGKAITKGYVPKKNGQVIANSGVTIGTGVDLGQQTADGLSAMGVPSSIIGFLVPYLGLRREAAVNKLSALPLVLSSDAVAILDSAVFKYYINKTALLFNKQAGQSLFAGRPKQVQAVAVSLCYQFGSPGHFPKTWSHLTSGNYTAAASELESPAAWGNKYMGRRKCEAARLKEFLK